MMSERPYWDIVTRSFMVRVAESPGTARLATHEEIKALLDDVTQEWREP